MPGFHPFHNSNFISQISQGKANVKLNLIEQNFDHNFVFPKIHLVPIYARGTIVLDRENRGGNRQNLENAGFEEGEENLPFSEKILPHILLLFN